MKTLPRAPLTVEIVHRIAGVPAAAWDDLGAGRPFVDHRWQRLAEAVLIDYDPRYVLLWEGQRLAGAAVCAVDRRFRQPRLQRFAGALLRLFPALRCGIPIASEPGLIVRPGGDAATYERALLAALDRLAARERAVFVKLEHLPPAEPVWPALRQAGYHQTGVWTDTALEIVWPSFEGYLAALPARKRRDVARIRRQARAQGIEVVPLAPAHAAAARLGELTGNVLRRHGAVDAYHPDLNLRAEAILGGDHQLLAIRRQGETVGCASLLSSGGETAAKWLGLDYERTWGTAAYLSLLLEMIARTIARGDTRLHTGATAYDTKRHLGATGAPRAGAVRLRGAALNRLAGAALQARRADESR